MIRVLKGEEKRRLAVGSKAKIREPGFVSDANGGDRNQTDTIFKHNTIDIFFNSIYTGNQETCNSEG